MGEIGICEGSEGIEIIGGTCPPDILEKWKTVLSIWKWGLSPVREDRQEDQQEEKSS